jgi:hypothetical protein
MDDGEHKDYVPPWVLMLGRIATPIILAISLTYFRMEHDRAIQSLQESVDKLSKAVEEIKKNSVAHKGSKMFPGEFMRGE